MSHHPDDPQLLEQRKADHLTLCADEDVEARGATTLLEQVHLVHCSLPELAVDEIDMSVELVGKRLRVPLMISGMTGGTGVARDVNRILAQVAQRHGMGFGVGSQRAMMRDPQLATSYEVRDVAPEVVLFGNIGVVQAAQSSTAEIGDLVGAIGADALCVHLNPAQEIIQDHGDRDFRGCVDAIARLVDELPVPVVAKETGCGMSANVVERLMKAGVTTVDVSGAGGTTWIGVEALRARGGRADVGKVLWDWGIPTAATVALASRAGATVIASGGIRDGLDCARALALGAQVASAALPYLRAAMSGGEEAADAVAEAMVKTLRAVMLLTGTRDVAGLREAPRVIGPALRRWLEVAR